MPTNLGEDLNWFTQIKYCLKSNFKTIHCLKCTKQLIFGVFSLILSIGRISLGQKYEDYLKLIFIAFYVIMHKSSEIFHNLSFFWKGMRAK